MGIIVLLGAGGKKYAHEHVKETFKLINKLSLDENDILYLSELIESEGMNYQLKAFENHLIPLSEQERMLEGEQIEIELKFKARQGAPISAGMIFASLFIEVFLLPNKSSASLPGSQVL